MLNYEKEVEKLSQMVHDKTEQLERLKEENQQLCVAGTRQVKISFSLRVLGARVERLKHLWQ